MTNAFYESNTRNPQTPPCGSCGSCGECVPQTRINARHSCQTPQHPQTPRAAVQNRAQTALQRHKLNIRNFRTLRVSASLAAHPHPGASPHWRDPADYDYGNPATQEPT